MKKSKEKQCDHNDFAFIEKAVNQFQAVTVDVAVPLHEWRSYQLWLKKVVEFGVSRVSVSFSLHPLLSANTEQLKKTMHSFFSWLMEFFVSHGFCQHEWLRFTRNLEKSRYMNIYAQHLPFKGFGIGAESFDGCIRSVNVAAVDSYYSALMASGALLKQCDVLTAQQLYLEKIIMGMRQIGGVPLEMLSKGLADEGKKLHEKILVLEREGLVKIVECNLQLTLVGLCFEDEIIAYLLS